MSVSTFKTQDFASSMERDRQLVRFWLYGVCLLVFAMVIVGGATRLTDSGLSITEWKPLLGAIPPLTSADWQIAFDKYRTIPEYQQINKGMSLDEFKFIYWWEWGHRFLGRLIGLFVAVPLALFWISGKLEPFLKPRLLLLFLLGGLQGFVGWWMVKSGLTERTDVSQYRLAAHLTLACVIFAWTVWLARGLAPHQVGHFTKSTERLAFWIMFAILFQVFLGALVAGLDAGLAFNDWPTMDGAIVPGGLFVLSPDWINFFENPKLVQFTHRTAGYLVFALVGLHLVLTMRSSSDLHHKRRAVILFVLALAQVVMGIITLVLQVPLFWGLVHQGGALVLLGFATAHLRGFKGAFPVSAMKA